MTEFRDEDGRRRRKLLGRCLLAAAALLLLLIASARVLFDRMLLGAVSNSYALLTALSLILLALAGTGAYLLRTVRSQ